MDRDDISVIGHLLSRHRPAHTVQQPRRDQKIEFSAAEECPVVQDAHLGKQRDSPLFIFVDRLIAASRLLAASRDCDLSECRLAPQSSAYSDREFRQAQCSYFL